MRDISKAFFGVTVLDHVSLDVNAGEVLALVGENGAGKSTLIKILNGDYQKDDGTILINGAPVQIENPRDAEALGIRMIYQELHYAPDLSVAENILLGHLPRRAGGLLVDWNATQQIARENLELLDVNIDPNALMRTLSVVERQIVQIVKALSAQARILVMDEPTAALTPREVSQLFEMIKTLQQQGVAIIYISHRLDEIYRIARRVFVLRDGKAVGVRGVSEVNQRELVQMMIGRQVAETRALVSREAEAEQPRAEVVLEIEGLTKPGAYEDINLQVHAGEIVGIFGLLGAGHANLTRALFGAEKTERGAVRLYGRAVAIHDPRTAQRAGVGLVPIDRKVEGLVLGMNVRENVTLSNWREVAQFGLFQRRKERADTQKWIDRLGIRMAGGMDVEARYLSGGNQQKVVLARWLEAQVKLLLLNEPTWGVDVGARSDIYALLEELAEQGMAVLMVSSDIKEVQSISHRILTMYKGRLTGEFTRAEATEENLLHAASGGAA
jgi:ABC-type sugar transport system ATPase subunit